MMIMLTLLTLGRTGNLASNESALRTRAVAWSFVPLLCAPLFYSQLGALNAGQTMHDALLISFEHRWFGEPSRTLARAYPSATLSALLHACYLSYYAIIYLPPLRLAWRGERIALDFRTRSPRAMCEAPWSALTMTASNVLNEMTERPGPRSVDAATDLLLFDTAGFLLFRADRVQRLFSTTLQLTNWPLQPSFTLPGQTLENAGQQFVLRFNVPRTKQWKGLYMFGVSTLFGVSRDLGQGRSFSVAVDPSWFPCW